MVALSYLATLIAGVIVGWVVNDKLNQVAFRMMARKLGEDIRAGRLSLDKTAKGD